MDDTALGNGIFTQILGQRPKEGAGWHTYVKPQRGQRDGKQRHVQKTHNKILIHWLSIARPIP